jgi:diguanylate cyclase (GGDEF)-like protein
VEGIDQHAAAGDADDGARFRETIRELSAGLEEGVSPSELLVRAGSVLNGFEDYNHRTIKRQRLQTEELQNMVTMLASTMKAVSSASDSSVNILGDIEKRITIVSELDDVRIIKAKLSACLIEIRKEAERQQKETGETIEQLSYELNRARNSAPSPPAKDGQDPITGLPLRQEGEQALAQAGRTGARAYVAVLVLDRLQLLNQRFGREAGDEILVTFTRMVQKQLVSEDQLFRWGGPALVALLSRGESLESVRSEVGRIMTTRLEHTIRTPSRSIMVPIAARWTLFPMMAAARLVYQKIDVFAAAPAPRE